MLPSPDAVVLVGEGFQLLRSRQRTSVEPVHWELVPGGLRARAANRVDVPPIGSEPRIVKVRKLRFRKGFGFFRGPEKSSAQGRTAFAEGTLALEELIQRRQD